MSREENRGMINAYEKMLQDGTAFKEVDLTMHQEPDISVASGNREDTPPIQLTDNPLGEVVNENENDYSEYDSVMEQKMSSLRSKMKSGGGRKSGGTITTPTQKELIALKKRVTQLEEALVLVMETHEQLLG